MFEEFEAEIAENVKKTVRKLRRGGTTAMSLQHLLMVTPTPKSGGPSGTNAGWVYREMFGKVVEVTPEASRFVMGDIGIGGGK